MICAKTQLIHTIFGIVRLTRLRWRDSNSISMPMPLNKPTNMDGCEILVYNVPNYLYKRGICEQATPKVRLNC